MPAWRAGAAGRRRVGVDRWPRLSTCGDIWM